MDELVIEEFQDVAQEDRWVTFTCPLNWRIRGGQIITVTDGEWSATGLIAIYAHYSETGTTRITVDTTPDEPCPLLVEA